MFFWRPKERKAPTPAKSVITAFCSRVASDIPRLAVICHKQLFVQASGTKQLAFHVITASHICTAQTYFILFPMLARLFAVILMVPVLFDITIVRELSRYCIQELFPTRTRREQSLYCRGRPMCLPCNIQLLHQHLFTVDDINTFQLSVFTFQLSTCEVVNSLHLSALTCVDRWFSFHIFYSGEIYFNNIKE